MGERGSVKRIAVVSCYFQKNYGSALQALATQWILDEYRIDNITIRYDGMEKQIKKQKYLFYIKQLTDPQIVFGKIGYIKVRLQKKFLLSTLGKNMRLRDNAIKAFESHFRLSPRLNSFEELSKYVGNFDAVLLGSDQLWLPSNLEANYYTLNWVPDGIRRISYATSFGVAALPRKYYKFAEDFLNKFDHLSVREESGKQIIREVCGRDAAVVCDPTLMFTEEQWLQIQKTERLYDKKYIFCYFLGDNPEQREFVKELKQYTGYDIVSILHLNVYVSGDEGYADYTPYDVDSADFINYIRNAEYVCTDSFHATAFSILNRKKFFVFRRFKNNYALQTNSRLDSLLGALGLESRLLQGTEDPRELAKMNISYDDVCVKLNILRAKNRDYLEKALALKVESGDN